jgi:hypothetical protein
MNRATPSGQPAGRASHRAGKPSRPFGDHQAHGDDLDRIASVFAAMPDLTSVRRVKPDGLISEECWMVWIEGSWLADHAGTGPTIEAAYRDAKNRLATIRSAA